MVCDKVVCVEDGVTKVVCERWCVTKLCVEDGMTKLCVKDGVCVCVTKLCVKDGRRAGRADGRRKDGRADGIQNQKQEPHTKNWGKSSALRSSWNRLLGYVARLGNQSAHFPLT